MRFLLHWLIGAMLIVVLGTLVGCAGFSSLSGGSIPIGGGDISGQLFQSTRATMPVAGATVELVNPSGNVTTTSITNNDGRFSFAKVSKGRWHVRTMQGDQFADVAIDIVDGDLVEVTLVLNAELTALRELQLQPAGPELSLQEGDTLTFQAIGIDPSGNTVPVNVSWVVHGNAGTITPDGIFTATRKGHCTIVAAYGDFTASVGMTVSISPKVVQ
ncbi:MAG: carboxypeptidase-like regulatory domain-containing protein [Armatimonadota bacterium]